jgi:hypothetical protein
MMGPGIAAGPHFLRFGCRARRQGRFPRRGFPVEFDLAGGPGSGRGLTAPVGSCRVSLEYRYSAVSRRVPSPALRLSAVPWVTLSSLAADRRFPSNLHEASSMAILSRSLYPKAPVPQDPKKSGFGLRLALLPSAPDLPLPASSFPCGIDWPSPEDRGFELQSVSGSPLAATTRQCPSGPIRASRKSGMVPVDNGDIVDNLD